MNRPVILEAMYQEIYDNKVFYRKIIDIKGEDSIESYLLHNLIKSMQKILVNSKISGLEKICPQVFMLQAMLC